MMRATSSSSAVVSPLRASHLASVLTAHRGFYTGLDESRVHRLRRSGMTFNKPRGRDTLSMAFESRIRVLPLNSIGDLYGPVQPPSHAFRTKREASLPGPRTGVSQAAAGDTTSGGATDTEHQQEGAKEWRVLIAEPLTSLQVERPLAFPSSHPSLYADWASYGHRSSGSTGTSQGGVFDQRPVDWRSFWSGEEGREHDEQQQEQQRRMLGAGGSTPADNEEEERFFHLAATNRRHLRQNGDSTLVPSSFSLRFRQPVPTVAAANGNSKNSDQPPSSSSSSSATAAEVQKVRFFLSMVVDPMIDHDRFRREEAQVELISGYRNLFYEAVELPATGGINKGGSSATAPPAASSMVADVIRVPALSVYSCGPRFFRAIAKLSQQSIIKGFHRIGNEAKEALITNRNFTVELYVPPLLLDQFEAAFEEEAWETPQSTLNPGRTALYPGLTPPRTLLDYDGWIGRRPELVEAIESGGKSLMRGKKYNLDGTEIEEREVLSHIRVFGSREDERKMLEGERATAHQSVAAGRGGGGRGGSLAEEEAGVKGAALRSGLLGEGE